MTAVRLLLATAVTTVMLFGGAASADLRDTCWETVPSFRLSALVCPKVPDGVG